MYSIQGSVETHGFLVALRGRMFEKGRLICFVSIFYMLVVVCDSNSYMKIRENSSSKNVIKFEFTDELLNKFTSCLCKNITRQCNFTYTQEESDDREMSTTAKAKITTIAEVNGPQGRSFFCFSCAIEDTNRTKENINRTTVCQKHFSAGDCVNTVSFRGEKTCGTECLSFKKNYDDESLEVEDDEICSQKTKGTNSEIVVVIIVILVIVLVSVLFAFVLWNKGVASRKFRFGAVNKTTESPCSCEDSQNLQGNSAQNNPLENSCYNYIDTALLENSDFAEEGKTNTTKNPRTSPTVASDESPVVNNEYTTIDDVNGSGLTQTNVQYSRLGEVTRDLTNPYHTLTTPELTTANSSATLYMRGHKELDTTVNIDKLTLRDNLDSTDTKSSGQYFILETASEQKALC
ncbi:uncharacterized protein LOC131946712 [Physella acuta]|uniref:uncharacterized protein LOC131946712 n=1 Tax=Physella acuta TaxID=109671 RepID=UPI0027DB19B2|nr:uncharacterized protein LOC131946712 [Physella acuta]